jgi:hypothetical protein
VNSEPLISANESGSDESSSDNDSYASADYFDTDDELNNIAGGSEKIVTLGHTVALNDVKINLCYDSGAAFSLIH